MRQIHKSTRGFTLIELSIVLIIIGLLLGAAIKGRDLIRSAQMKKFYNTAIKQWEIMFNSYTDATGIVLGGPAVVNATTKMAYNEYVGQCGITANATTKKVEGCRVSDKIPTALQPTTNSDLLIKNEKFYYVTGGNDTAKEYLEAAGLELPAGQGTYYNAYAVNSELGKTMVYVLLGADFLSQSRQVNLCWDQSCSTTKQIGPNSESNPDDRTGNFLLLVNLPYDVAVSVDKIIDGEANGRAGNLRCVKSYDSVIPVEKFDDGSDNITSVVDSSIASIEDTVECGGIFHWNDRNKKYVTALYELTM